MLLRLFRHLKKSERAFSVLSRISAALLVLAAIFFTQLVFADKETRVFVFPGGYEHVEGWENPLRVITQDLSSEAAYTDFTDANSARVVGTSTTLTEESAADVLDATTGAPQEVLVPQDIPVGVDVPTSTLVPLDQDILTLPIPDASNVDGPSQDVRGDESTSKADSSPEQFSFVNVAHAQEATSSTHTHESETAGTTTSSQFEEPTARCHVSGAPCHTMLLSGFSLGGALQESTLQVVNLTLSLAAHAPEDGTEKIVVSYATTNGWKLAGELALQGESSNKSRGGYVNFALPDVDTWDAIDRLRVLVEYVTENGDQTTVALDGAWLDVGYLATDGEAVTGISNITTELSSADHELRKIEKDTLTTEDTTIRFASLDGAVTNGLALKSDHATYVGLSHATMYLNLTNERDADTIARLSLFAEGDGLSVDRARVFRKGIPVVRQVPTFGVTGYFCDAGWQSSPTDGVGAFRCAGSEEVRRCDAQNADGTNCIVNGDQIGVKEERSYRDGWEEVSVLPHDDTFSFAQILGNDLGETIPETYAGVADIPLDAILSPGGTAYVALDISFPENTAGTMYILSRGDTGGETLAPFAWNASWNYRLPVDIANDTDHGYLDRPVKIVIGPEAQKFWETVRTDGADIRVVDDEIGKETPFWISAFDAERKVAVIWAKLSALKPRALSSLYIYYGNPDAHAAGSFRETFHTAQGIPRYAVLGEDTGTISLDILSHENGNTVVIGDGSSVTLDQGALKRYERVSSGAFVYATDPLTVVALGGDNSRVAIPFSQAGTQFVIPRTPEGRSISILPVFDETHVVISSTDGVVQELTLAPQGPSTQIVLPGGLITITADQPILASIARSGGLGGVALAPATSDAQYGITSGGISLGTTADNTGFRTRCASGGAKSFDGRRASTSIDVSACAEGTIETGDAFVLDQVSAPVGITVESPDKTDIMLSPQDEDAFGYGTVLGFSARAIAVMCKPGSESAWEIRSPGGALISQGSCYANESGPSRVVTARGHNEAPYLLGTTITTIGTTSAPIMVFAEEAQAGQEILLPTLRTVTMPIAARGYFPESAPTTIKEGEFVFPSERRADDVTREGKEIPHANDLLSNVRDFGVEDVPAFRFRFNPQRSALLSGLREALGMTPFTVNNIALIHQNLGEINADIVVQNLDGDEWTVEVRDAGKKLRPGKYALTMVLNDNGEIIEDAFDFYFGMLSINVSKSEYQLGDGVEIFAGALTNSGNTICDARLKLQITRPDGVKDDVDLPPSGFCHGNNVTSVPDYFASYAAPVTGTYAMHLVSLDAEGNMVNELRDAFDVASSTVLSVERSGPTRIYPLAPYDMKIRLTAKEDFVGKVIESFPKEFIIIDRGGGFLQDVGEVYTATWDVSIKAGETQELSYRFDAADISPYRYLLGPAKIEKDGQPVFTEHRKWQIASDAAGQMMLFWDSGSNVPTGWTCVSCTAGDPLFQRFFIGAATYGTTSGTSTHLHTSTTTVNLTLDAAVSENTTNNTLVSPTTHQHTMTAVIGASTSLPPYRQLRVIRSDVAGDVTVPNGAIAMFDVASSSLPSNWYRYASQDGYFPYGENTVGTTGGTTTHTHTVSSSTDQSVDAGYRQRFTGTQVSIAPQVHQHSVTATSSSENHTPPYLDVVFAKVTATATAPNTLIALWNDTPAAGWATLSNPGGAFNGVFVRASTTYGGTGGSSSHTPANLNATTSVPTPVSTARTSVTPAGISGTHTHGVSITFGDTDNAPPAIEVIVAKRFVGVSVYTQQDFRFYANTNGLTPTDPWPSGGSDLSENDAINTPAVSMSPGQVVRMRMNVWVTNATATALSQDWKLQYTESTDCASALNWNDVAPLASSTALWRGYNNTSVAQNATLSSFLLSTSTVAETYVEENNATTTPVEIPLGGIGEWDWVVQHNTAAANTNYCFRMVKSSGVPLDSYVEYPQILTNSNPDQAVLVAPFDNEAPASTTPEFKFYSTDPESNALDYEIEVDDDPLFASPVIDANSVSNPELFDNVPNPANKSPFNTGDTIRYRAGSALTNGTTYWWRVRAIDPNGSNTYGAWSTSWSFTIDTTVTVTRWHQTTSAQFQTDTLVGVEATSSVNNFITLISGSTTGTTTSTAINFADAATGTAWGSASWNVTIVTGALVTHVEYQLPDESWAKIPNTDLPGNAAGFNTSPINLLTVDPSVYPTIRLVSVFTGLLGTGPRFNDWTVDWGFVVATPDLYALFDNEKTGTTTPSFEFSTTDPQGDSLTYEIQWSTDPTFAASTTRTSNVSAGFQNLTTPADTDPFNSGDRVRFTIQAADALTASTTYWWRVRAKDSLGSNLYSFWSDKRSFTTDLSVSVPTWFQTTDAQFQTDSLTGTEVYGANGVRVATSTTEALIAYGESVVQTPRYRFWNGTAWGSELSAQSVGAAINWVVTKASPLTGEYMLAVMGRDRRTTVQVYKDGAWGNLVQLTNNASNANARGVGVAYETLSGNAVAVSCDGDADPTYRVWSATSSSWWSAGSIDMSSANNCEWIKMASDPISNEIILLGRDTGSRYEAQVWNGSSWGSTTTLGSMTDFAREGMDVQYEDSGNQAVIVASNASAASFVWKSWAGTSSWSGLNTQALGNDFEWGSLKRDRGSDNMALCYIDEDNDIGVVRWTGASWGGAFSERDTGGNSDLGRATDCEFENTAGRDGYIMDSYSDTTNGRYQFWNGVSWSIEASVSTIQDSFTVQSRRTEDNLILSVFFDDVNTQYDFSYWNGTTWSTIQTIESTPSISSTPFGEPFMMVAKNPATEGTLISSQIDFADGLAPAWKDVMWSASTTGSSTVAIQVQYLTASGTWALIPDTDLPGNSSGATSSPISLTNLNTSTYASLRLLADLTCVLGNCPTLHDWTVHWASGIDLSGTAKQFDLTSNVTSGTVAVAVNGTLQTGKTGSISGGMWTIPNVTVFPGNTVTVFVSGAADANEAVNVSRYVGPGNMGGLLLNELHLTLGTGSSTGTTSPTVNANINLYDNSASGNEDIFYNVDAGNDLTLCAVSGCAAAGLVVHAGTYRPDSASSGDINTYNLRISTGATLTADGNTINTGGSWRNLSAFDANTGTVIFTATSGARTIDNTGASTSTFNNVTFGTSGNSTWSLVTPLVTSGNIAMNFGTVSPGTQGITVSGNLAIGASGQFVKGTGTTTFTGAVTRVWTDNTTAKQDLGNVLIDGTTKTVQLGSGVKATNITIGADDTLDATGANYGMTVNGNWTNNNVFSAHSGTVTFASTSQATINPGTSPFGNLIFAGGGGSWSFLTTGATTTGDVTIATGTVAFPSNTFAIGGSLVVSGSTGSFSAGSGTVKLTSTATGKTVQFGTSTPYHLLFNGSGGTWTMTGTNATTSSSTVIIAGTPTLPAGVFAVGGNFDNQSGSFVAIQSSVLKLTASTLTHMVRGNNSSFGSLLFAGGANWTMPDTNATSSGSVTISSGSVTLPSGVFAVGQSFVNSTTFTHASGTVKFFATSTGNSITPGNSQFGNLDVSGTTGGWTVTGNATTSGNLSLTRGSVFIQTSGTTLEVRGTFTNAVGGASTTWSGTRLWLNASSSYAINTKTTGGDAYGILKLGVNEAVSAWNSSVTTYEVDPSASLYSQDHGSVDGELYIFGNYRKSSGADYWDYATDFDGAALGGSGRAVTVRFANNATSTYVGAGLQILGTSTASTTITNQGSGTYGMVLSGATLNADSYVFRNLGNQGLQLLATTTITAFAHGDFELAVSGGSLITMSSTTVDKNQGAQWSQVRFATTTAITGFNVTALGTATSSVRFKDHYGNLGGEGFDNDPGGNPGSIRWDDSAYVISVSGTVYSDAGVTPMASTTCDNVTPVVRVKVAGGLSYAAACSSVDGTYTVPGVTFIGDVVLTTYLDTNGGPRGTVVTRSATANLTGINIYQHRVIVRHEDVIPMTIASMNAWDSGDDNDIPFLVSTTGPNTLTVRSETEFWIWNSKTFVPGGNITLSSGGSGQNYDGTFHIDNNAVFTAAGSESHAVGGRFAVDAGATFTAVNSTFTFTATTTGKIIAAVPSPITFFDVAFTGVGGSWSWSGTFVIQNNLTVSAGTVGGTGDVTVEGGTVSGAGVIAMTGGTFAVESTSNFGGVTDWSFYNLRFGNGTVAATSTKIGSSTITVSNILTVSALDILEASNSLWILSGGGTPVTISGTLSPNTSTFRYTSAGATNIRALPYYRLELRPSAAGSPTYTMLAGSFAIGENLTIGDGTNPISVTANTNDPGVNVTGNFTTNTGATYTASDVGWFGVGGSWSNNGTFSHATGLVTFTSTSTGRTIAAGSSSFGSVEFNNPSGGWTLSTHATSSGAWTLNQVGDFTVASGTTLEIDGTFTNLVSGAATTWTGSVLHLNSGTSHTINTKVAGADTYNILRVGTSTDVKMWNSDSVTKTVLGTGSLYSQNHAGVSGDLYVWGDYVRTSGTEYWSYTTDFDGAALGGGSRQVNVRLASGTAVALTGGIWEILGTAAATTSIDVQASGAYALRVAGGTINGQYFSVRNTDAAGLNISGAPTVTSLSDGDFELAQNGGRSISVSASAIDANPLKIFQRNRFATTTAIGGHNVMATGSSTSAWRFNLAYGNLAGESFDSDPGGDPGMLIWDDSAANIFISGVVYADSGATPLGAPTCDGVTQNVRLRVQGAGVYTSACNGTTGAYSISNVIFNPGDTLTVYLDTNGGARGATVSLDPATNIANMDIYRNTVIVRTESATPQSITAMNQYDNTNDSDIPFIANIGSPNTLQVFSGTELRVWTGKTFAPVGNVTVSANASSTDNKDGSLFVETNASFVAAGTEVHTFGGKFTLNAAASFTAANSSVVMNATTTGKTITTQNSTFYDLSFTGLGGAWSIGGTATATGNVLITGGAVTFPGSELVVGGSFQHSGGPVSSFDANGGVVKFVSTTTGKTIQTGTSTFADVMFSGAGGGWTWGDVHATTTGTVTIATGTLALPAGTLAVAESFDNSGGVFTANQSSTLKLTATTSAWSVRGNGSSFGNVIFTGGASWSFGDAHATSSGSIRILSGTTTLPTGVLAVGQSFVNSDKFVHASGTVKFTATTTGHSITSGNSLFGSVELNSSGGGWTITGNATTSDAFSLRAANTFTQTTGTTLEVRGAFTNLVGGGATTWTGSRLFVNSGSANYTVNTKTQGGDIYNILSIGANTQLRAWNSSASTHEIDASASLYSQDHAGIDGELYIFGSYVRGSGTDYWSYATDFDGVALGGSSRTVTVRFASGATSTFSGATLQVTGGATATTTITNQGSGSYAISLSDMTFSAQYFAFRNLHTSGLQLLGATSLSSFQNGDFELATAGGSLIAIASTTIDQNASMQFTRIRFATTTAITGTNVYRQGTSSAAITFASAYGNLSSERYDDDGGDACGQIRFGDSSCLFVDQSAFRWRNDDGGEGVPASEWYSVSWSKRKRVTVTNPNSGTLTNIPVKFDIPYDLDMQSDFDDLRFTDADGVTVLSYWVERYTASATSTVWVKVPSISGSSNATIYMYYGNGTAPYNGVGTSTFMFFDDYEDNNITEYSGDTSLMSTLASMNQERNYGVGASAGNESSGQTTNGVGQVGLGIGRDTTFRFFQYIDMTSGPSDESCVLFGVQTPLSAHDNYAVCLTPFSQDKIVIAKDVIYNARTDGATRLASTSVTWTTGWYEVSVDWLSTNAINVSVYDSTGALFATSSATDSSYTSGGIGYGYWGQHGGWDIYSARPYAAVSPTTVIGPEEIDSGASWGVAENTLLANLQSGVNTRLRLQVYNSGSALTGENFRLQVAPKGVSPNCESVASGNYSDVPVASSCGSGVACMSASSQFADHAPTTDLLSVPGTATFTGGEILENASNQTNGLNVDNGVYTEVEYNFQLTGYAVADAYCFRTTKAGVALDNYTHVAEVSVLHAPTVSGYSFNQNQNIALIEGTTTTVYATATVSDLNGYTDLDFATSTFYRSGLSSQMCAANDQNCYQMSSTSCSFSACAGNSCTLTCAAEVQYFADPTDVVSPYPSEAWQAFTDVVDLSGARVTASATQELLTLQAFSITNTLNYGSVVVGADTNAYNPTTTAQNTGNSQLDFDISGTDMTSGSSTIAITNQKYATSSFTYSACTTCTTASSTAQTYLVNLLKPTSTVSIVRQSIYWGLNVPLGTAATTHTGAMTFTAI